MATAIIRPRYTLAANGTIPGAIRWDPWYGTVQPAAVATGPAELQAPQYQFRAPWFATPQAGGLLINGNQQATIDAEIGYAASAGLKYWAYGWNNQIAPAADDMRNAWSLHQTSSVASNMNWCMLQGMASAGPPATWAAAIPGMVAYFQQSNYQKVLTNRPLYYFLIDASLGSSWGGSWANVAAAFSALRTATTAAGLGSPYIVMLSPVPSTAAADAALAGADAIGSYFAPGAGSTVAQWPPFDVTVQTFWAQMGATGTPIVPIGITGWDPRPRLTPQFVNACTVRLSDYAFVTVPTQGQLTSHLQAAVSYVVANGTQCPSKAILIYSWTECSEGGNAIIPTYGSGSGPDTGRITALQGVTW